MDKMTRQEQLVFCRKCSNRKMDLKQGLICGLTEARAAFEKECSDFVLDDTVKEIPLNDTEGLQPEEIRQKLEPDAIERLRMEQKLFTGIISGLIVGLIGAILWGLITVVTRFQIGYMAVAIGAGVGLTIRKTGNGIDPIFGYCGAVISLLSVLLGNFLSVVGFIANAQGLGYIEVLTRFNYSYLPEVMGETFSFIDILFYGLAVFEGYKFSFRLITAKALAGMKQMNSYQR